jgi:hypothetical protein
LPLPGIGVIGSAVIKECSGPRFLETSIRTFLSGRVDVKFHVNTEARDAGAEVKVTVEGHGQKVSKTRSLYDQQSATLATDVS